MTKLYQLQQHERQIRIAEYQAVASSPSRDSRYSSLSLERFRSSAKYHDRPAAADIAFCVAAYSLEMPEDAIANSLDSQYLSSNPNPSTRAAYIRRTMAKARSWAQR
jgi:hypothetical protein